MSNEERGGLEVLALYNAAFELTKRLDQLGVPTVFSRIRNVPKEGAKQPSGRRPDLLPVPMRGLFLGAWPHRHWSTFKNLWEQRGIVTDVLTAALRGVHEELAKQGPRSERFEAAFVAVSAANEALRPAGVTINIHVYTRGQAVERDVFFLSITTFEQEGGPVFPENLKPGVKLTLDGHAGTWSILDVWGGPNQGAPLSFGGISSAKHFGQLWRTNARRNSASGQHAAGLRAASKESKEKKREPAMKRAVRLIQAAAVWQKATEEEAPSAPASKSPTAAAMGPGAVRSGPGAALALPGAQAVQHQQHQAMAAAAAAAASVTPPGVHQDAAVAPLAGGHYHHHHEGVAICQHCAGSGVVHL